MNECIFCRIAAGELAADVIARNDVAIAIRDLNPQAPEHALVIPVKHADNLGDYVAIAGAAEVGGLLSLASQVGRSASPSGHRIVVNEGGDGGQTVHHLHLHVLAGRRMTWPPG